MGDLVYMREKDQVKIREFQGDEVIEVRVHYGSCDDVIGYVYGDFYGKTCGKSLRSMPNHWVEN
jgi:phage gp37-like protein